MDMVNSVRIVWKKWGNIERDEYLKIVKQNNFTFTIVLDIDLDMSAIDINSFLFIICYFKTISMEWGIYEWTIKYSRNVWFNNSSI